MNFNIDLEMVREHWIQIQPDLMFMLPRLFMIMLVLFVIWMIAMSVLFALVFHPKALDRQSDRILELDLKRIDLEYDLSKERSAREKMRRDLNDLERRHAQELHELHSAIDELVQAVHENRRPSISRRSEYRPRFSLRN